MILKKKKNKGKNRKRGMGNGEWETGNGQGKNTLSSIAHNLLKYKNIYKLFLKSANYYNKIYNNILYECYEGLQFS